MRVWKPCVFYDVITRDRPTVSCLTKRLTGESHATRSCVCTSCGPSVVPLLVQIYWHWLCCASANGVKSIAPPPFTPVSVS